MIQNIERFRANHNFPVFDERKALPECRIKLRIRRTTKQVSPSITKLVFMATNDISQELSSRFRLLYVPCPIPARKVKGKQGFPRAGGEAILRNFEVLSSKLRNQHVAARETTR